MLLKIGILKICLMSFNPLNQVYVFNLSRIVEAKTRSHRSCFNPLNQVYVFNPQEFVEKSKIYLGFNPLNQVYVFNTDRISAYETFINSSFNPLNQVYVFNGGKI